MLLKAACFFHHSDVIPSSILQKLRLEKYKDNILNILVLVSKII